MRLLLAAVLALVVAAPVEAQAARDARATVARLYQDFAGDARTTGPAFVEQPRAVLQRYLDPSLAGLLLADRACVTRSGAVCRLDFAPLRGTQDPDARDVDVRRSRDPAVVIVAMSGSEGSPYVELTYRLVRTPAGWRVHDIRYPGGQSLRRILGATPGK